MQFIAVLSVLPNGRVGKFQEFETLGEADAHVARFLTDFPVAFSVRNAAEMPSGTWVLNASNQQLSFSPHDELVTIESTALQAIRVLAAAAPAPVEQAVLNIIGDPGSTL